MVQDRLFAGECLPTADSDIDVERIKLDREADPTAGFSRDQGRAAAQEGLIDGVTRARVVQHRPAHALDRLLRAVLGLGVLLPARYVPERCLLPVAGPIAFFADGIPTRLVLPVVVASSDYEPLLGPDDLGADRKAVLLEALCNRPRVQRAMPDVGDPAREERPRLAPVGDPVVTNLPHPLRVVDARPMPLLGIVVHAIGWIGDHQLRHGLAEQGRDDVSVGAVAAD